MAVIKHYIFVNLDTTIQPSTSSPMPDTGQNLSGFQTESSKVSSEDTTFMVDERRAISGGAIAAIVIIGVLIVIIFIAFAISINIRFAIRWKNKSVFEPQDTNHRDTTKGFGKLFH